MIEYIMYKADIYTSIQYIINLPFCLSDYNASLLNNTEYHIGAQYVYGIGWQWVDGTAVDPTFLSNYGITNVSGDCLVWTYTSLVIQDKCDASGKFLCDISV